MDRPAHVLGDGGQDESFRKIASRPGHSPTRSRTCAIRRALPLLATSWLSTILTNTPLTILGSP